MKPVLRGADRSTWKGDAAHTSTKRARAQRTFPLGPCESCGGRGADRHHIIDGNTGNNAKGNITILCRRCHMAEDGRLQRFKASRIITPVTAPTPCINCGRPSKPTRRGRCHACNEYLRRKGRERPYVQDGRGEAAALRMTCARGHPKSAENSRYTGGTRFCIPCNTELKRVERRRARPPKERT